mmetsp:Transcript_41455/g.76593  ORF Transcript_41455/g.76593 Transcript_41455/m.76593 type:complete len:111 (+) Transcript_41455:179-511(+)
MNRTCPRACGWDCEWEKTGAAHVPDRKLNFFFSETRDREWKDRPLRRSSTDDAAADDADSGATAPEDRRNRARRRTEEGMRIIVPFSCGGAVCAVGVGSLALRLLGSDDV